jgi:hypothetical protein
MRTAFDTSDRFEIGEFLATIVDASKRSLMAFALDQANIVMENMKALYWAKVEIPKVMIFTGRGSQIMIRGERIQVDDGFLEALYLSDVPSVPDDLQFSSPPGYIFVCMIVWAFAHEFAHHLRAHDVVRPSEITAAGADASVQGNLESAEDQMSLEYDADCVATAALYRTVQHRFEAIHSDESIRSFTLYVIYWALRSLPSSSHTSSSHGTFASRMRDTAGKLSILPKEFFPEGGVDVNGVTQLSAYHRGMLCVRIDQFDYQYCEAAGFDFASYSTRAQWIPGAAPHIRQWQGIKGQVSDKSGTPT